MTGPKDRREASRLLEAYWQARWMLENRPEQPSITTKLEAAEQACIEAMLGSKTVTDQQRKFNTLEIECAHYHQSFLKAEKEVAEWKDRFDKLLQSTGNQQELEK